MEAIEYTAIEDGIPLNCVICVKKKFLPEDQCDELIRYYDSAIEQLKAPNVGFFNDRLIWSSNIPELAPAKAIMRQTKNNTIKLISDFHKLEHPLYGDSIMLVSWPQGLAMPPHYDNRHPRKEEPHTTPWREYAGVIYLNDDYEGGEIYFSNANPHIVLKPEKGMLVVFASGDGYMHGVKAAYGNTRYTMPCWFTRDASRNESDTPTY